MLFSRLPSSRRRRSNPNQRTFRFVERRELLARRFKQTITGATLLLLVGLLLGTSSGRYAAAWSLGRFQQTLAWISGNADDRRSIDADWRRRRLFDMEQARHKLRATYDGYDERLQRLLDEAGLDPDHAILRWGNFNKALLLPSTIFEPDDNGRSYRFRPNTRAIWLRNLKSTEGVLAYFSIPDLPNVVELAESTGATIIPESVQNTNSWGLRGDEPNLSTPRRGLILGDSYMQGLFVRDDETPSVCLERDLAARFGEPVEILNTGHLGYSPEQEYYTLLEYADRFRPQFIVLSLFANDFGDLFEVLEGRADWEENRYWLGEIAAYCNGRGLPLVIVPAPWVNHVEGARKTAHYPGRIPDIVPDGAIYFDPMEAFVEVQGRETLARRAAGKPTSPSPLFNGHLGDGHFSPLGCQVWAEAVGRRLELVLSEFQSTGR